MITSIQKFFDRIEAGSVRLSANIKKRTLYAICIVAACAAIILQLALPELFSGSPYILSLLIVGVLSWFGGFRAAILAMMVLLAGRIYFFILPYQGFSTTNILSRAPELISFLAASLILAVLLSVRRRARLHAEQARGETEEHKNRLSAIMTSALDSIIVMDNKGLVIDFNPAAEQMFGYRKQDVIGKEMAQFIIPEQYRAQHRKGIAHYLKTGEGPVLNKRIEISALRSDGTEFDVELAIIPLTAKGNPLFTGYLRDISERKEMERRRDDFISMASHELKTPVTSIKAYSQSLLRQFRKRGENHFAERMTAVIFQLNRMNLLVDDLLNVARGNTRNYKLHIERFAIGKLIQEVAKSVEAISPKHRIAIECNHIEIEGDRNRVAQVLDNVLTNAVKYSPGTPEITMHCKKDDDNVIIRIIDQGIGIPEKQRKDIFKLYHRVSNQGPIFPGLGLGLYIASDIIRLHNGTIWVEDTAGGGSTFCVKLPIYHGKQNEKEVTPDR